MDPSRLLLRFMWLHSDGLEGIGHESGFEKVRESRSAGLWSSSFECRSPWRASADSEGTHEAIGVSCKGSSIVLAQGKRAFYGRRLHWHMCESLLEGGIQLQAPVAHRWRAALISRCSAPPGTIRLKAEKQSARQALRGGSSHSITAVFGCCLLGVVLMSHVGQDNVELSAAKKAPGQSSGRDGCAKKWVRWQAAAASKTLGNVSA